MKNILKCVLLLAVTLISYPSLAQADTKLDLNSYKGKVVYLDFWASWCIPCRKSFPWMNELQQKYKNDLVVIGINLDQERELADEFIKETSPQFKIIYDPNGTLATEFQVAAMPSAFILDREGKVVIKHLGFHTKKIPLYEQEIQQLIHPQ